IALIWKNPVAFIFAKASSPIGALFKLITLVTGSLWGKPMWGAWWVWDARLTSVLLLFFIYIAHISLLNAFDNPKRGERPSAILALVGIINLPIIKWSVDWWNTLHQPASVTRLDTPAIHYEMLIPLLVMSLSFMLYYITIVIIRMHNEILVRKINSLRIS
ncbi:MAG: heme ABC transporter permease CcmC, partial [Pseudomonadota bacterium]|nr:heme ABC transporter permease CcmC [Pseudomonadota bacterium]